MIKRMFDLFFAIVSILIFIVPLLIVAAWVMLESKGPVLYVSNRIGKDGQVFRMPKFRTMQVDTPVVATHLLDNAQQYFTSSGGFLRKSSLDELPQLWSVLVGDMSVVGPRPALDSQADLISMRKKLGIDKLQPGVTGWAQINGRDELTIPDKVALDHEYLIRRSMLFDVSIIFRTIVKVFTRSGVTH